MVKAKKEDRFRDFIFQEVDRKADPLIDQIIGKLFYEFSSLYGEDDLKEMFDDLLSTRELLNDLRLIPIQMFLNRDMKKEFKEYGDGTLTLDFTA